MDSSTSLSMLSTKVKPVSPISGVTLLRSCLFLLFLIIKKNAPDPIALFSFISLYLVLRTGSFPLILGLWFSRQVS